MLDGSLARRLARSRDHGRVHGADDRRGGDRGRGCQLATARPRGGRHERIVGLFARPASADAARPARTSRPVRKPSPPAAARNRTGWRRAKPAHVLEHGRWAILEPAGEHLQTLLALLQQVSQRSGTRRITVRQGAHPIRQHPHAAGGLTTPRGRLDVEIATTPLEQVAGLDLDITATVSACERASPTTSPARPAVRSATPLAASTLPPAPSGASVRVVTSFVMTTSQVLAAVPAT